MTDRPIPDGPAPELEGEKTQGDIRQEVAERRFRQLARTFRDRYAFHSLLGRGAFASVFLVRNLKLERLEALKVLSDTHDSMASGERFIAEAKMAASLDHPHIVKVYDYGELDNNLWYSMQYVAGPTLRAEFRARGSFHTHEIVQLTMALLDALGYSHEQGIVHRDIKPGNVLIGPRGTPYLADFGIAKSLEGGLQTLTGSIWGTPTYISPEQAQAKDLDGRADLYSLAIMLYELIAGSPPFQAANPVKAVLRRLQEEPEPLIEVAPSVAPGLAAVIMKALTRDRQGRYPDAQAMHGALAELSGQPTQRSSLVPIAAAPAGKDLVFPPEEGSSEATVPSHPTPAPTTRPAPLPAPKKRWPWIAALLLAVVTLVGMTAWNLWPRAESPAGPLGEVAEATPPETQAPAPGASQASPPVTFDPNFFEAAPDEELSPAQDAAPPPPVAKSDAPTPEPAPQAPPAAPPAQTAPPPEPRVRRPVKAPRLLEEAVPQVTEEQRALCQNRSVIVSVRVDEEGRVQRAKVLKSPEPGCSEAARLAASAYRFEPAEDFEGLPVAADMTLSIRFHPPES